MTDNKNDSLEFLYLNYFNWFIVFPLKIKLSAVMLNLTSLSDVIDFLCMVDR